MYWKVILIILYVPDTNLNTVTEQQLVKKQQYGNLIRFTFWHLSAREQATCLLATHFKATSTISTSHSIIELRRTGNRGLFYSERFCVRAQAEITVQCTIAPWRVGLFNLFLCYSHSAAERNTCKAERPCSGNRYPLAALSRRFTLWWHERYKQTARWHQQVAASRDLQTNH